MNFADNIISPFVFIIKQLFLFSYELTENNGFSIILLSFAISLLLLPVFILIEKAKKKDDALKNKMKPLIDEIKRCYKGQERYYYLKTLNRQHHYSPVKALIPILSLLIQIPFFIAAYQFLENYEPLKGVSFLFIRDLSTPDHLLGAINILPIAMTLVNLLTAYFYTKNGNTAERKQMLIVAGIFLVLLFNLPSGLVLYWTMNNVFSFFRLFITNPEVFRKKQNQVQSNQISIIELKKRFIQIIPKLKITFIVITIIALLGQLNWAFQHSFYQFELRILLTLTLSILTTLFIALLVVFHKTDLSLKNKISFMEIFLQLWPTFKPLFLTLLIVTVLSQLNWAMNFNFDDIILRLFLSFVLSAFTIIFIAIVVLLFQDKISIPATNIKFRISSFGIAFKISFWILVLISLFSQINWAYHHHFENIVPRVIIVLIISWIVVLVIANIKERINRDERFTITELKKHFKLLLPKLTIAFIIISIIAIFLQLNWALHNSFNDFVWRVFLALFVGFFTTILISPAFYVLYKLKVSFTTIKVKPWIFFSFLFLAIYFHLASQFHFTGYNNDLSIFAAIVLIPVQFFGTIYFIRYRKSINLYLFQLVSFILTILFIFQLLNTWVTFSDIEMHYTILNMNWSIANSKLSDIVFGGIIFTLITTPFFYKQSLLKLDINSKPNWLVYLLSVIYLTGFIFLWNPLAIFSSYPDNFEFTALDILKNNFDLFIIAFSILTLFFLILPKRIKKLWIIILLVITALSFIHNTLLPIDVGSLQENKFVKQDNIAQPLFHYFFEGVGFVILFLALKWLIQKEYKKQIIISLVVLNLILISQSLILSIQTGYFYKKDEISADISNSISFSKKKENIVFFIIDTFHGWHMNKILKEEPNIKNELEGFTWYPNTLAISSLTCSSIGPILGGFDYSVDNLNEDKNRTLEEKITEISESFYRKVKSKGYDFTANKIIYSKIDKNKFDTFLPRWHEDWNRWNNKLNIGVVKEIGYTLLWENAAFYSTPIFIKPKVYNNGKWLHGDIQGNKNTRITMFYNFLRLLPFISNTKNENPNFIYLHSMAAHHPWDIIEENGKMRNDVTPYENNKWVFKTIAKWIKWMKENHVYDNTKIIFLSDHGPYLKNDKRLIDSDISLIPNPELNISNGIPLFALMMVKDFNNNEEFKTDWRLLSNADVSAIAFDENDPTKINPPLQRTLPATITDWEKQIWFNKQIDIIDKFEVSDNIYDLRNWKRLK